MRCSFPAANQTKQNDKNLIIDWLMSDCKLLFNWMTQSIPRHDWWVSQSLGKPDCEKRAKPQKRKCKLDVRSLNVCFEAIDKIR